MDLTLNTIIEVIDEAASRFGVQDEVILPTNFNLEKQDSWGRTATHLNLVGANIPYERVQRRVRERLGVDYLHFSK